MVISTQKMMLYGLIVDLMSINAVNFIQWKNIQCVMVVVGATCSGLKRPYLFLKDTRLNDQSYHNQWLPLYIEEGERLF